MNIKVRDKNGVYILDMEGNIDINASDFVETIGWVLTHRSREILCNFSGVNMIDYVGISLMAVAYKNILNHKGKIKFYSVPPHVKKLFSVVGMDRVLETYDTEEQALQSFKEDKQFSKIMTKKLRRRFKRIPLRCDIQFKQKFASHQDFSCGRVINISAIGLFVFADKVFNIGDILTTKINLHPSPGPIEFDTKVVWIADKEIQPQDAPGMGLEFHELESEKQKQIMEFIEKHLTHSSENED